MIRVWVTDVRGWFTDDMVGAADKMDVVTVDVVRLRLRLGFILVRKKAPLS